MLSILYRGCSQFTFTFPIMGLYVYICDIMLYVEYTTFGHFECFALNMRCLWWFSPSGQYMFHIIIYTAECTWKLFKISASYARTFSLIRICWAGRLVIILVFPPDFLCEKPSHFRNLLVRELVGVWIVSTTRSHMHQSIKTISENQISA